MKVKLVGTGSMISCDIPASYIINKHILIDIPNGNTRILKSQNLIKNIDSLIITHTHADHVFDVPFLFLSFLKRGKKLKVYVSKKNAKVLKKLVKLGLPHIYHEMFKSKIIEFIYDKKFVIDKLEVERFPVIHGKLKEAYGYTFKEKNKVITFTGDTSYCKSVEQAYLKSDLFICDVTFIKGTIKHMGINNILNLLKLKENVLIIPVHLSPESKKELLKIKNKNIKLLNDGKEIKYE